MFSRTRNCLAEDCEIGARGATALTHRRVVSKLCGWHQGHDNRRQAPEGYKGVTDKPKSSPENSTHARAARYQGQPELATPQSDRSVPLRVSRDSWCLRDYKWPEGREPRSTDGLAAIARASSDVSTYCSRRLSLSNDSKPTAPMSPPVALYKRRQQCVDMLAA